MADREVLALPAVGAFGGFGRGGHGRGKDATESATRGNPWRFNLLTSCCFLSCRDANASAATKYRAYPFALLFGDITLQRKQSKINCAIENNASATSVL